MSSHQKYSDELKNKAIEYAKTHSRDTTAKKFNIAPSTIAIWIQKEREKKLGIIWKPTSEINNKEEIYEYAKTHSPSEASDHFKLSIENVYSIVQKLNKLKGVQNPNFKYKRNKNTQVEEVKYGSMQIEEPVEKEMGLTSEPIKPKSKIAIMISDDPDAILNILKGL